jgi:hypothetical protein
VIHLLASAEPKAYVILAPSIIDPIKGFRDVSHGLGVCAVSKGWEFYWEGKRYYVGAPDAPTARKYLHIDHSRAAEGAGSPRELTNIIALGLQLEEGTIRAFPGTRPTQ